MHIENHQSTVEGERSNIERNSISSRGNSEVQRVSEGLMKTEIKQVDVKIVKEEQTNLDFQWDKTMGGMSFGDTADPLQKSEIS